MRRDQLHQKIIDRLERLPPPFQAHYGVVPLPPPESIPMYELNAPAASAIEAIGRLDAIVSASPQPFLATRILHRQEALSSSAIEGTQSTLDEILELDATGADSGQAAARQVRSYSLTLERFLALLQRDGRSALTLDLVRSLHRDIMSTDPGYEDPPGEFRQRVVWIGGGRLDIAHSTFNPPPPGRVLDCMNDHLRFLREDGDVVQPLPLPIRMALGHAHFEAIHPFRDGNGRVGRILLPLQMAAEGHAPLFLAPYLEAHRSDYYAALKEAQQRLSLHPLCELFCLAIVAAVKEVEETMRALSALRQRWAVAVSFRQGSSARRALDLLSSWPVLTVARLSELLGVSFQAANDAVERLTQAGILTERTGYQKNRIFAAKDVLHIVNRPFGTPPPDAAS